MGDKTTKVSKDLTVRYNILSDIVASPTRIEILNKLFDFPEGLTYDELVKKMSEEAGVQRHLDMLLKDNIIENQSGKYILSKNGREVYSDLGKVASKVKEAGVLSDL
jgi:DNA-binding transcriptional ArsR family regulator